MQEMKGIGRIKIHEGKFEEFRQLAEQCVEIVREKDSGTIQYELFLSDDRTECLVFERYRDSEAGMDHGENVGAMMEPLSKVAVITGEVFGDPAPKLRAMLEAQQVKIYKPFLAA